MGCIGNESFNHSYESKRYELRLLVRVLGELAQIRGGMHVFVAPGGKINSSTDPEELRKWILHSRRAETISPQKGGLVDLDAFGQRLFWRHLRVRRPAGPLALSCVRMTWFWQWQRGPLLPDMFPFELGSAERD